MNTCWFITTVIQSLILPYVLFSMFINHLQSIINICSNFTITTKVRFLEVNKPIVIYIQFNQWPFINSVQTLQWPSK